MFIEAQQQTINAPNQADYRVNTGAPAQSELEEDQQQMIQSKSHNPVKCCCAIS